MMGSSYLGWVQLYAAIRKPPALKALIPTVTPPDPDRNFPMQFGDLRTLDAVVARDAVRQDDAGHLRARPARVVRPPAVLRSRPPHGPHDAGVARLARSPDARCLLAGAELPARARGRVDLPMLHSAAGTTTCSWGRPRTTPSRATRPHQFLMLGPWGHRINQGRRIGAIDFGPEAVVDLDAHFERWFDRWLKEIAERRRARCPRCATS